MSVFLLVAMSVECCLAVSRPYRPPCLTVRRATIVVVLVWMLGVVVAASPIALEGTFYGHNGVCMPLHIEDPYAAGWQYSSAVFVGVNLTAVVGTKYLRIHCRRGWLGSRVVSVLDSGAGGPGFKSQPRRCRVTVL